MTTFDPSSPHLVPSIHIQTAEQEYPSYFEGDMFPVDPYFPQLTQPSLNDGSNYYDYPQPGLLSSGHNTLSVTPGSSFELDDIAFELENLPPFLSGPDTSSPYVDAASSQTSSSASYSPIDGGLSPSSLHSPMPSPASSYTSWSPASFRSDVSLSLSDIESPVSPSPITPDRAAFLFPSSGPIRRRSSVSSTSSHPYPQSPASEFAISMDGHLSVQSAGHHRSKSLSSLPHFTPTRPRTVASPAMLDANSRRRRHPASFECDECQQTFTALFSLKRHQQSHTGERPYKCSIPGCEQAFFNSSDCKRHEKSKKRHKEVLGQ
ncbi:hypothetical protein HYDPIDRAFT_166311 [Hydnomerulius pinastri MD-312]|nr:hypothetical protein HYDPIDRAFT_166311 [Hydnomerulius pinastri MD-312]